MGHNCNHNQLGLHPHIYVTGPDNLGLVGTSCCWSWHWSEPILQYKNYSTNFYFVLNETNYMTPCKQVLTAVRGHSKKENKKIRPKEKEKEKEKTMTPLTFIARVGLSLQCRCPHLLLACHSPCVCCHCP